MLMLMLLQAAAANSASLAPLVRPFTFDLATLGDRPPDPLAAARALLDGGDCARTGEDEITVCGRVRRGGGQRLPFPEQRHDPGEIVRLPGEMPTAESAGAGRSCARPGSCEPSRLMQTLGTVLSGLYHAARGEDAPVH